MRRFSDGKVRRSREEWEQIFERFRSSGQSGAAFCRKHKLPKSSFENWKKKVGRPRAVKKRAPSFVEWTAPVEPNAPLSTPEASLSQGELELSLPGGVLLRWKP